MAAGSDDWQRTIEAGRTAFFLDVDGTLLDFRQRPEDVVADAALRDTLERLRKAAGGAVALVSGRMISDLDRIMNPLELAAGGTHGAELRFADGRREAMAGEALDEVRSALAPFVADREGVMMEDKGAAIAVHFRHAPGREAEVARFLDEIVVQPDLMVQHGKMVAEVKSARSHKGKAIEILMETPPFAGRVPLFIGDDLTDEHGFASVDRLDGISIKVGGTEEQSIARHRLADTGAVRNFLNGICLSASAS